MAEPTDRSRRQMNREMRAMQRERERIMKDLHEMRQEMIQARGAQQTGDSETPLPPADTTNPWGSSKVGNRPVNMHIDQTSGHYWF